MPVVTISAAYGAGGSTIGPALAERLGVAFVDRAIPVAVAARLAVSLEEAKAREEAVDSLLERMLVRLAPSGQVFGGALAPEVLDDRPYLAATEAIIRERAEQGAVILGRGAALVLREHPTALHVRLSGPPQRRIAQAADRNPELSPDEARQLLKKTDRAREAYVRQYYGADATDPRLYHLVIDATALGQDDLIELLALAAAARGGRGRPTSR
jgi:cytidylate kinase